MTPRLRQERLRRWLSTSIALLGILILVWLGTYPAFRVIVSVGLAAAVSLLLIGAALVGIYFGFHLVRGYLVAKPPTY